MRHKRDRSSTKLCEIKSKLTARLRAGGCPIPAETDPELPPDLIIKVTSTANSRLYFYRASAECVLAVRIRNHSFDNLRVVKCGIQLAWRAPRLFWLREPPYLDKKRVFRFPSGREFAYDVVLNPLIVNKTEVFAGGELSGVLLAYSPVRLPTDCLHGESFPAEISIEDQYGRRHSSIVDLIADHTYTMDWSRLHRGRRKGLFESPGDRNWDTESHLLTGSGTGAADHEEEKSST